MWITDNSAIHQYTLTFTKFKSFYLYIMKYSIRIYVILYRTSHPSLNPSDRVLSRL